MKVWGDASVGKCLASKGREFSSQRPGNKWLVWRHLCIPICGEGRQRQRQVDPCLRLTGQTA